MKKRIKKQIVLVVYGATGVGKTDVALSIAQHIASEIINIDVGQFYTPLTIGTAKHDWRSSPVTHHLFDIIDTPDSFTVIKYHVLIKEKIHEIVSRGNLPIIVGGSSFYVHSLFYPPRSLENNGSPKTYHMPADSKKYWNMLYDLDPQRAIKIDMADTYRIMRALDIWNTTGKQPAHCIPHYDPWFDYILVNVTRDTQELNDRINKRVVEMFNDGWLQEVKQLIGTDWQDFILKKKIIGYNEIFNYLHTSNNSRLSYDQTVEVIGNKTRQYAKRQRTFWRKMEREIKNEISYNGHYIGCLEHLNLTNMDIHLYINGLLERLVFMDKK